MTMDRIGTTAMNKYATMSRLRRLQSSLFLHEPIKRKRRYNPAKTARYSTKLKIPPLRRRTSPSSPITTRAEQITSSRERRLPTSLSPVSTRFMDLQSEEILYLKSRVHVRTSAAE